MSLKKSKKFECLWNFIFWVCFKILDFSQNADLGYLYDIVCDTRLQNQEPDNLVKRDHLNACINYVYKLKYLCLCFICLY